MSCPSFAPGNCGCQSRQKKAPWLSAYLGEIAAFSPGMTHQHDDQVDVTVDALEELLQSCGGISQGMDLS